MVLHHAIDPAQVVGAPCRADVVGVGMEVVLMGTHLGLGPRGQQSDEDQGAQSGAHREADGGVHCLR